MNIYQWKNQIKIFNKSFEKSAPSEQWNKNTLANLPRFKPENSIWNLEWKYFGDKEKAMVLVGASPCLKEDVKKLKVLDDDFCIICANSSLKYLLKNDIKPDYVICLDSDEIDIPQHLDIERDDIDLISSTVVCPKALDSWKGPIWYMPYYAIDKDLRPKVRRKLGRRIPGGGNSMTQALMVCTTIWGAHTVIFVANEYCFDKAKSYYADKDAAKQEKLKKLYPTIDIKGRERWILPALYTYVIWTQKACTELTPPGYFIDTSFGLLGKDTPAIHNVELSEAIDQVKHAFKVKRELNKLGMKDKILEGLREKKDESGKVFHYNMQEQQGWILQLKRS